MSDVDRALEDREIRPRRDDGGLVQENPRAGRDQQERRSEHSDEREPTSCPLLRKRRYRDKRHESRRMRAVDRITNFGERRGDDREANLAEHVLGFALRRFIERVGHGEGRARASELNERNGAKLAEATRQLTDDRCLGRDAKRGDRMAAHTSDRVRERLLVDEARAQDRVRKGLPPGAQAVEVLDLARGEELLRDEKLRELGLRARWLGGLSLRGRYADRGTDHPHDFLRGLVL